MKFESSKNARTGFYGISPETLAPQALKKRAMKDYSSENAGDMRQRIFLWDAGCSVMKTKLCYLL